MDTSPAVAYVCAWCGRRFGEPPPDGELVSHGICAACAAAEFGFDVETLEAEAHGMGTEEV